MRHGAHGWSAEKYKCKESAQYIDYFDKIAEQDVYGDTKEKALTESPFLCMLEYGGNNEG